ncbi:ParB/RepB/Spo0J family partition protein [Agrilactobacillus fermenti]|uniref:ParB/RepB/Spo0J family partition protein n=1 Tax=Agrilactobacillus fermenti TaxID=2586909 RepID=UPI001E3910C4|nr:ParB/RepB/Spo0J family partition protein [Agrilactobacillus fermenti]MCD2255501.1 ParB/RepB/Spo0J family partition protein [Agrilactobacillus fermenti]
MAERKKALGRGIDALFQDFNGETTHDQETVETLALSELRPNPYQPRRDFDETALQELTASIKKSGVFQPIIVRKSIQGYEIIAGERRFRASKLAGKTTIPAIIRDVSEDEMMEIAVLENLQREDLTPIEEALAYETLIKKLNLTQTEVSNRLGKSRPYIANYLRLLTLPEATKRLLQAKQLSMGQARTLLGLKNKAQIDALARRTIKESLTVRQLEKIVNALNEEKASKQVIKKPVKSTFIRATEQHLADKFNTKVTLAEQKDGKGKIEIGYLSTEDLNRILDILNVSLD